MTMLPLPRQLDLIVRLNNHTGLDYVYMLQTAKTVVAPTWYIYIYMYYMYMYV